MPLPFLHRLVIIGFIVLLAAGRLPAHGQAYQWTSLAGSTGGDGILDGTGMEARFNYPKGVAVDGSGNIYVADYNSHTIRKVTNDGVVTTFAGKADSSGSVDGIGSEARFYFPSAVVVDGNGTVYVADSGNHVIRKIRSDGAVSTFAGAAGTFGLVDGSGGEARFRYPEGITLDGLGNLYVADRLNNRIRKITNAGQVTTLKGSHPGHVYPEGSQPDLPFTTPSSVAVDADGNVYVASESAIYKVTSAGLLTTLAGSPGGRGMTDGIGTSARFFSPFGLMLDATGNFYVADAGNSTIRKITRAGVVTTVAGAATYNGGISGDADGIGGNARFNNPRGVAIDGSGNLIVADSSNHTIRKITSAGAVTTLAGAVNRSGSNDGAGTSARFFKPYGMAVDGNGTQYVADLSNAVIRKITSTGEVTTFAGEAGSFGGNDGIGTEARFFAPSSVALAPSGDLYVADTYNRTIRKITSGGAVTTVARLPGFSGNAMRTGSNADANEHLGVAADGLGNVYIADALLQVIRKITAAGEMTIVAGQEGSFGRSVDGTGTDAQFYNPTCVVVDTSGNLYVTETSGQTIRKITSAGVVTTLAGQTGNNGGYADGIGNKAAFSGPYGLAIDGSGNLYVADRNNCAIRKITSTGEVTTLGGLVRVLGNRDGYGTDARFYFPIGIAATADGILYVSNSEANNIVIGMPPRLTTSQDTTEAGTALRVAFTLPSTPLHGSLKLKFEGAVSRTFTLASSQENSGPHAFNFNPAAPEESSAITQGLSIPDGVYAVTLSYQNTSGNNTVSTVAISLTLDRSAPSLNAVTIGSDNASPAWAALGQKVTLQFTSNEPIQAPAVMLLGVAAAVTNTEGNTWIATATVSETTAQGAATFSIAAKDLAGNAAPALSETTSQVTVDRTAPVLNLPANFQVEAASTAGAVISFSADATDNLDASPLFVSTPASGSLFPIGKNIVIASSTDHAGNRSTGIFTVTVNASRVDSTPPVVTITAPTERLVPGPFTISGTVRENVALKSFTVKRNGVPLTLDAPLSFVADANLPWQISAVPPENGINVIVVEATDFAGRKSVATRVLAYLNRRIGLAGTYDALLVPKAAVDLNQAGLLSVTITPYGTFSGRLLFSWGSVPFSGSLDNDGAASFNPARGISLDVRDRAHSNRSLGKLSFSVEDPAGISGTLSAGNHVLATFEGKKAPFSFKTPVPAELLNLPVGTAPIQGNYNVAFQAETPELAYPQGNGYAQLTLRKTGTVTLLGSLADGTRYVAAGRLRADHTVALFASLYKKAGIFCGNLAFADLADSDVSGEGMLWVRPANRTPFYPAGWPAGIQAKAIGTKYANPVSVNFGQGDANTIEGNAVLVFSNGIAESIARYPLSLDPSNGIIAAIPAIDAPYTLAFAPASGLFRGTFTHGQWTDIFNGILLNKGLNKRGFGYFLTTPSLESGQSGAVSLTPQP